jgi:hypothetical protein
MGYEVYFKIPTDLVFQGTKERIMIMLGQSLISKKLSKKS